MKSAVKNAASWPGMIAIILLQTSCQQGGTAASTNNISEAGSANASASAAPAPAAPEPSTGPVALASDASLPTPCREVVRAAQVCIDSLHSEGGARSAELRAGYEHNVREKLQFARDSWAPAPDEATRSRLCALDLGSMQQSQVDYHCGPR